MEALEEPNQLTSEPTIANLQKCKELTKTHIDDCNTEALKRWKDRVRTWKLGAKEPFAFVRNQAPLKSTVLSTPNAILSHPYEVQHALMGYWSEVASWHDPEGCDKALAALDN